MNSTLRILYNQAMSAFDARGAASEAVDFGAQGYFSEGSNSSAFLLSASNEFHDYYPIDLGYHYGEGVVNDPSPPGAGCSLDVTENSDYLHDLGDLIYNTTDGIGIVQFTLSGEFSDEANPWKVQFGPGFSSLGTTEDSDPSDGYSRAYNVMPDAEAEGIEVEFIDKAGNAREKTLAAMADRKGPTANFYQFLPVRTYSTQSPVTFHVVIEDATAGVRSGELYADEDQDGILGEGEMLDESALADRFDWTTPQDEGKYDIYATGVDNVSNAFVSDPHPVAVVDARSDLEYAKRFTQDYWVEMTDTGVLQRSLDGNTFVPLPDGNFSSALDQRHAVPVDLEVVSVVSATSPVHVYPATACLMDNKGNVYLYDLTSEAPIGVSTIPGDYLDVIDFEIGSRGIESEVYLLRTANHGTIVDVTPQGDGPYFQFEGDAPWYSDYGADALNFELVEDATGFTDRLYTMTNGVGLGQGGGVIYRLPKNGSATDFEVVNGSPMDRTQGISFAASPRSNILLAYCDDNADGTGEMHYYNRKQDTQQTHRFIECSTESMGFESTVSQAQFLRHAYYLNHGVLPHRVVGPQETRKLTIAYDFHIPTSGSDVNEEAINSFIEDLKEISDELNADATIEQTAVLHPVIGASFAQTIYFATRAAKIFNATEAPFFIRVSDADQDFFVDKVNDVTAAEALEEIISQKWCRGAHTGEVYNGMHFLNTSGSYVQLATTTYADDYFDMVEELVAAYDKKFLWHEASYVGPNRGWWGFILYDTQAFRETVWDSTVVVMLHEDNDPTTTGTNLDTVYGCWLASDKKADWGASLQNFWWGLSQYTGAVDGYTPKKLYLDSAAAKAALGIENASGKEETTGNGNKFKELIINPGKSLGWDAWGPHTYDAPFDILRRQLLQYLSMGATYIQTEYTITDLHGNQYNSAFKPVLEEVRDGTVCIPAKERIRNQSLVSIALSDQDSAPVPEYLWVNPTAKIGSELDGSWKFGIFYPSYDIDWDEAGYDNRFFPEPNGYGIHHSYMKHIIREYSVDGVPYYDIGWIGDNFENGFQQNNLAQGWSYDPGDGYSGGVSLFASAGYSGAAAQTLSSTDSAKFGIYRFYYVYLPKVKGEAEVFRIRCELKTSGAEAGEVFLGYRTYNGKNVDQATLTAIDATTATLANAGWTVFETGDINADILNPIRYVAVELWFGTQGVVDAAFDNVVVVQKKEGTSTYFPRFTGTATIDSTHGPYHEDSSIFYKGDFLVADIVDHGTMEGTFNEYRGLEDLFPNIGIGAFDNVHSATTTSCIGDEINTHVKYIGLWSQIGYYPWVWHSEPDNPDNFILGGDHHPLRLKRQPQDTPDGGKNRFYAKYFHDQEFVYYGLLQRNPYGHVPLYFGDSYSDLPSCSNPTSTDGMDIALSPDFSQKENAGTFEPYLMGNYLNFYQDRQVINLHSTYQGEERGVLASLILKKTTESNDLLTNQYDLILVDPIEGGVEIYGDDRVEVSEEVISVTASFNSEYVSNYQIGQATPIISGNSYQIDLPIFGHKVVVFQTRTRIR